MVAVAAVLSCDSAEPGINLVAFCHFIDRPTDRCRTTTADGHCRGACSGSDNMSFGYCTSILFGNHSFANRASRLYETLNKYFAHFFEIYTTSGRGFFPSLATTALHFFHLLRYPLLSRRLMSCAQIPAEHIHHDYEHIDQLTCTAQKCRTDHARYFIEFIGLVPFALSPASGTFCGVFLHCQDRSMDTPSTLFLWPILTAHILFIDGGLKLS